MHGFSALQRAEIAEIGATTLLLAANVRGFSALQRAEIAEISERDFFIFFFLRFSALQRAEIAEMLTRLPASSRSSRVSVLFNEPKLLKFRREQQRRYCAQKFQCSSTSRNC